MRLFPVRHSDLIRCLGFTKSTLTKTIKSQVPEEYLFKNSGRVYGISGEGVEIILNSKGVDLNVPELTVVPTQVGGSGKTTTTISLAIGTRRISSSRHPIVILDTDPQGSTSKQLTGERAKPGEPVLLHYIEKKAGLTDCLWDLGDNVWLMKSSLENLYLDREIEKKPIKVKNSMYDLCREIYEKIGETTKIFVDTPPALSACTNSFYMACHKLSREGVRTNVVVPVRQDGFSVDGAGICVKEAKDTLYAFAETREGLNVLALLVMVDARVKNSSIDTIKLLLENEHTKDIIFPTFIGYSGDATKAQLSNESIFSKDVFKKIPKIAQDYNDVVLGLLYQPTEIEGQ